MLTLLIRTAWNQNIEEKCYHFRAQEEVCNRSPPVANQAQDQICDEEYMKSNASEVLRLFKQLLIVGDQTLPYLVLRTKGLLREPCSSLGYELRQSVSRDSAEEYPGPRLQNPENLSVAGWVLKRPEHHFEKIEAFLAVGRRREFIIRLSVHLGNIIVTGGLNILPFNLNPKHL